MKQKKNKHPFAACRHSSCPERRSCLRWRIGLDSDPDMVVFDFAPATRRSRRCKFFKPIPDE